uniref:Uncharacterized protein n=1 Tax=Pristhesancus plagipennis TaxID=1955184 RepID=A0A2K8JV68_PRIPG|nr:secreted hypothetical protein [Pristhesancus plagipennis]
MSFLWLLYLCLLLWLNKTQTVVKLYKYNFCAYSSTQSSNLMKHKRKKHTFI